MMQAKKSIVVIKRVTPLILSIYLIHVHPLIFGEMGGAFSFMRNYTSLGIIGCTLCAVCFIFIVCALLDFGRYKLFMYVEQVVVEKWGKA